MSAVQEKKTVIAPVKLDQLFHEVVDRIGRYGCFTGSIPHEENGEQAIELTAVSLEDDQELEVVATVYIRGNRLKELQEGELS